MSLRGTAVAAGAACVLAAAGCGGGGGASSGTATLSSTAVQEQVQAQKEGIALQARVQRTAAGRRLTGINCQPNSATHTTFVCIGRTSGGLEQALFVTVSPSGAITVAGQSSVPTPGGPAAPAEEQPPSG